MNGLKIMDKRIDKKIMDREFMEESFKFFMIGKKNVLLLVSVDISGDYILLINGVRIDTRNEKLNESLDIYFLPDYENYNLSLFKENTSGRFKNVLRKEALRSKFEKINIYIFENMLLGISERSNIFFNTVLDNDSKIRLKRKSRYYFSNYSINELKKTDPFIVKMFALSFIKNVRLSGDSSFIFQKYCFKIEALKEDCFILTKEKESDLEDTQIDWDNISEEIRNLKKIIYFRRKNDR